MANQCVNCGGEVTNQTVGTIAQACDECRTMWQRQAVEGAIRVLETNGYTVIPPQSSAATKSK